MNFLNDLPELNFAQKDTSVIESEMITCFEKVTGRTLYPGDPLRLIVLALAYECTQLRNIIDFSAKQNLLKFSTEGFIDHIGSLVDVDRLMPSHATTTLEFLLSEPQKSVVTVPKNTKASDSNGTVIFETVDAAQINIGQTSVCIKAVCTVAGTVGNDFYPGQINQIINPFGYLCSVANTTVSSGGEDIEDIDNFKNRIHTAPEGFSTAGPDGAYEFWAKTASQLISHVSVKSPSPGCVEIIPLLKNGDIPTQNILDSVYDICNDKKRRPLTDKLVVKKPEVVKFNIDITYYISRSNVSIGTSIQKNVDSAIEEYILWQKSLLGRDINPSELTKKVILAGAKRIEIKSPIFSILEYFQIAVVDSINIVYGGIEDD